MLREGIKGILICMVNEPQLLPFIQYRHRIFLLPTHINAQTLKTLSDSIVELATTQLPKQPEWKHYAPHFNFDFEAMNRCLLKDSTQEGLCFPLFLLVSQFTVAFNPVLNCQNLRCFQEASLQGESQRCDTLSIAVVSKNAEARLMAFVFRL